MSCFGRARRRLELGGFAITVHAEVETTDGAFSLIETSEVEPGAGPLLHVDRDCAKSFGPLPEGYP